MTEHRAYKLKRAVRFPYLDYATSERRRLMCAAEVRINRRTAPAIYRGVIAVTRDDNGSFALDGAGEPVDWLVDMLRFDETALFDAMAERDALTRPVLEDLADAITDFHHRAERRPEAGGGAAMAALIENNAQSFAACPDQALDPEAVERLLAGWSRQLDDQRTRLDQRRAGGHVRHCHGDLHLGNIVLYEGRPTLFDAIEFNDAFADIDILYDLAFLLMDLAHRDRADLAALVFNRYCDATGDSSGLALLPLFVSLRAGIRAHVEAVAASAQSDRSEGRRLFAGARRYLRHACAALQTSPPHLVAIGGLSGTGKSSLARTLAPELCQAPGARVVRTDCIRKRLAGVALKARLGADGYAAEMTRRTYRALVVEAGEVLAAGRTVIADGVFAAADERDAMRDLARRFGIPSSASGSTPRRRRWRPALALAAAMFPTRGPMSSGCSWALLSVNSTGSRWTPRGRRKRRRRRPDGLCRRARAARRAMRDGTFLFGFSLVMISDRGAPAGG